MAQKTIVQLVDDIDGTEIEDGKGETVSFALDGKAYELDLTTKNADKFRGLFQEYIAVARKAAGTRAKSASKPGRTNTAEIREWAKQQGMTVPDRGRLPKEVTDAWEAK